MPHRSLRSRKFRHAAVLLAVLVSAAPAGTAPPGGTPAPATATPRPLAAVEQRANELLDVLRKDDESQTRSFVTSALDASFLAMGPIATHLAQFARMRKTLGDFSVREVRMESAYRADFVLESNGGRAHLLALETERGAPFRIASIRLGPDAAARAPVPSFASLEEADRALQHLAAMGSFSGVVLIARTGLPDWTRAYGMADRSRGLPNTTETRFDVGSITKVLTSIAVMQLVEERRIDLEAPMSRYLDGFPAGVADRVRVVDLLRMESGYGDYRSPAFLARKARTRTLADYLEHFRTLRPQTPPRTRAIYSNVGYILLGAIVERASGQSYDDYVTKNVLAAAGMKDSAFREHGADETGTAVGYTRDGGPAEGGGLRTNRDLLDARSNPAGGSYATAADLLRLNRALRGNRLLTDASTRFLLNGFAEEPGIPTRRGVAGGAPGVSAVVLDDTRAGVAVIVLANLDAPIAEEVGDRLLGLLLQPPAMAPQVATKEAAPPAAAVPMRIENDQPVVEVRIGDAGPFSFLVDTGAQGSGRISRALAERLGLKTVGSVQTGDPSGRNSKTSSLVRVPRLSLGTRTWRDVDLLVAGEPGGHLGDGILGYELWSGGLLTLDYPAGELRLEPGTLPAADGRDVLDYTAEHGVPTLAIEVAGTTVDAHIDSGSMGWLLLPSKVASRLKLKGEPRVVGRARTLFNEFDIKEATLDGSVRIGRHVLAEPRLEISDLLPQGNLGGQLLRSFAVTFDPRSRRVRFSRDSAAPITREPRVRSGLMLQFGPDGVLVTGTAPGSPAAKAGLQAKDRIVRLNGRPTAEVGPDGVRKLLGTPEEIVLTVRRADGEVEVRLTPAARP